MAADEETKSNAETTGSGEGKAGDARSAERRQKERRRTPVTIDLKAEEVKPAAASAKPATASEQAAARPEPQPKPDVQAKPDAAAEAPRAAADKPQADRVGAAPFSAARARSFVNFDDSTRRTVLAGIAGGVIALVLVIVLQAIGLLPAPGRSAADAAAEQARAAADAIAPLERRVTAAEAMIEGLPALRTDLAGVGERVDVLQADRASLAAKTDVEGVVTMLGQLRQRLDALPPSATRDDLDQIAERIGRLEVTVAAGGGDGSASDTAIASLSSQLGAAETALRSLTDRLNAAEAQMAELGTPDPMAGGEAAVRAIAITALRRASEGDTPFTSELDMVAALGVPGDDIAGLRPYATRGVPARSTLVAEFPVVADEILRASATADADAGFLGQVVAGLGGLVSIRPAGPIEGGDPQAIVSRMTDAVGKGDLATALAERSGLPEAGLAASSAWAASAEERVTLDQLVERIARNLGVTTG